MGGGSASTSPTTAPLYAGLADSASSRHRAAGRREALSTAHAGRRVPLRGPAAQRGTAHARGQVSRRAGAPCAAGRARSHRRRIAGMLPRGRQGARRVLTSGARVQRSSRRARTRRTGISWSIPGRSLPHALRLRVAAGWDESAVDAALARYRDEGLGWASPGACRIDRPDRARMLVARRVVLRPGLQAFDFSGRLGFLTHMVRNIGPGR